jgi:hypothetical protein
MIPYGALFMGYSYERAKYRRADWCRKGNAAGFRNETGQRLYAPGNSERNIAPATLLLEKIIEERDKFVMKRLEIKIKIPSRAREILKKLRE